MPIPLLPPIPDMPGLHKSITRSADWLPWLLVVAIVAQGAVPLQAHTVLAKAPGGQVVVVCTWEGPRTVVFDGSDGAPIDQADRVSPACLFSQLLAAASLTSTQVRPSPVFVASASPEIPSTRTLHRLSQRIHAIRGPPDSFVSI